MTTLLNRSRIARIALLSTLAIAGVTATTVASASADGNPITNPPRPTHTVCSEGADYIWCFNGDGSSILCKKDFSACVEWTSDGTRVDY